LALECTARAGALWRLAWRDRLIEPLLALLDAEPGGCEIALVLFGAQVHPYSAAVVESSLAWCSSVAQFRRQLENLGFAGGGNQPVGLAEALLEAASLFACGSSSAGGGGSGSSAAVQQHCLVCLASDPGTQPVPWPFAEDCGVVSVERRGGGLAGWHAAGRLHLMAVWVGSQLPRAVVAVVGRGCQFSVAHIAQPSLGHAYLSVPRCVCVPAPNPLRACLWPLQAKLAGLATSAELCHAFWRRGITLSLAGPSLLASSQQLWHVLSLVSDAPLRWALSPMPANAPAAAAMEVA